MIPNPRWSAVVAISLLLACSGEDKDVTGDSGATTPTMITPTTETGTTTTEPGELSVTLATDTGPFSGATVVFYDRAGAILGTETTDGSGVATWPDFPPGGAVTAATAGSESFIATALDLRPGTFAMDPTGFGLSAAVGTMDIELPGSFKGATTYQVRNGCDSNSATVGIPTSLPVSRECLDGSGRGVAMGVARDGAEPIAYTLLTDVFVGEIAPANVTLPAWRTDFASFEVTTTNIPKNVVDVDVDVDTIWNGVELYSSSGATQPAGGGPLVFPLDHVVGGLSGNAIVVNVNRTTTGNYARSAYAQGFTATPAGATIDLGAKLPTRIHEIDLDIGTRTLTWTVDDQVPWADGFLSQVRWQLGKTEYNWTLVGPPPDATELTLPALPESLQSWLFIAPGDLATLPTIAYFGSTAVDDWSDLRASFPPQWLLQPLGDPPPFEVQIASGG